MNLVPSTPLKKQSLIFAPMEGITDCLYRKAIEDLYPDWDILFTDFLRVSSVAKYPAKHLIKHLGEEIYKNEKDIKKTVFQILTSENALTEEIAIQLQDLNIPWLDINLGCPSNTVIKRKGGSFILSDPDLLKKILEKVRKNYKGHLTAKIRLGFNDDQLFLKNISTIQDLGFDAITIHARTRVQLYKGKADWSYIKQAVEEIKIPVIGNGDVWNFEDINNIFSQTNCHSVMIARGALKSPWLASEFKQNRKFSKTEKAIELNRYFTKLFNEYKIHHIQDYSILKKFKGLSRYVFQDFANGSEIQTKALRSTSPENFLELISSLKDLSNE